MSERNLTTDEGAAQRPEYWRGLEQLQGAPELAAWIENEFPDEDHEGGGPDGVSRRSFLSLMGASLALAGLSASGCNVIRKPVETILPFARRPEDSVPGRPIRYATSALVGGSVLGLLVESQDGRPTKIEGHPGHPMSRGATSAWAQAEILNLYDPDRSRTAVKQGAAATMAEAVALLDDTGAALAATAGAGLALVTGYRPSPTFHRLLDELRARFPQATIHVDDAVHGANSAEGARLVGRAGHRAVPDLSAADVIVALDADILGTDGDAVRNARDFADGRRVSAERSDMNRLWVAEPSFSTTGAMADHRIRVAAAGVRGILEAVAARVLAHVGVPEGAEAAVQGLAAGALDPAHAEWVAVLAEDLVAHRGRAVIVVGERQPPAVHALAHVVNAALQADGTTVSWHRDPADHGRDLADLADRLRAGAVSTLVVLGANPAQSAPADLAFGELLAKAGRTIHHGLFQDETARACAWHVPATHFLEAWGDARASDGTVSLQQPLVAPLFGGVSEIEVLARLLGRGATTGHDLVRETWAGQVPQGTDPAAAWREWIHDGLGPEQPRVDAPALAAEALPPPPQAGQGLEFDFVVDAKVLDGRYANNAWLQELPDPMTKLTWDNAALVSPATASALGVESGEIAELGANGRTVEAPVHVVPGLADDVVVLPLGYGRTAAGRVGNGVGFDANAVRSSRSPWFAGGGELRGTGRKMKLASTQMHGTLKEPDAKLFGTVIRAGKERHAILRQGRVEDYKRDPQVFESLEILPAAEVKTSLWKEPNETAGQQWGMSIDLNACTGCNACTIACQAENNIPVVGKERVLKGREMHWIRLDRYFSGSEEEAEAAFQPVPCMQCENAPCESVCPVAATSHSPDGLNDMAYNRCVGTRYCANNCPYKVRRFNYFNFSKENDSETPDPWTTGSIPLGRMATMQRNPDVTVRFRGVMEKCTYCVQRISRARIDAKVAGDGTIPDGELVTACQEACPAQAIVFGDISDPASAVSRVKAEPRSYSMLREMNTQPRTTYLARLRNPHPKLAGASSPAAGHEPAARREGH